MKIQETGLTKMNAETKTEVGFSLIELLVTMTGILLVSYAAQTLILAQQREVAKMENRMDYLSFSGMVGGSLRTNSSCENLIKDSAGALLNTQFDPQVAATDDGQPFSIKVGSNNLIEGGSVPQFNFRFDRLRFAKAVLKNFDSATGISTFAGELVASATAQIGRSGIQLGGKPLGQVAVLVDANKKVIGCLGEDSSAQAALEIMTKDCAAKTGTGLQTGKFGEAQTVFRNGGYLERWQDTYICLKGEWNFVVSTLVNKAST